MTEQLQQTIKEELIKLPIEMREAIRSSGWEEITKNVGGGYLLNEDEINNLQVEVLLVLVNAEYLSDLSINIEWRVEIDKKKAEKIAEELTEKIFTPISNKINEILKNSDKIKYSNWKQNINFIVSGGDYIAFLEERKE